MAHINKDNTKPEKQPNYKKSELNAYIIPKTVRQLQQNISVILTSAKLAPKPRNIKKQRKRQQSINGLNVTTSRTGTIKDKRTLFTTSIKNLTYKSLRERNIKLWIDSITK